MKAIKTIPTTLSWPKKYDITFLTQKIKKSRQLESNQHQPGYNRVSLSVGPCRGCDYYLHLYIIKTISTIFDQSNHRKVKKSTPLDLNQDPLTLQDQVPLHLTKGSSWIRHTFHPLLYYFEIMTFWKNFWPLGLEPRSPSLTTGRLSLRPQPVLVKYLEISL